MTERRWTASLDPHTTERNIFDRFKEKHLVTGNVCVGIHVPSRMPTALTNKIPIPLIHGARMPKAEGLGQENVNVVLAKRGPESCQGGTRIAVALRNMVAILCGYLRSEGQTLSALRLRREKGMSRFNVCNSVLGTKVNPAASLDALSEVSKRRMFLGPFVVVALALVFVGTGCGGGSKNLIPGTQVKRSQKNESIIQRVEEYRHAVERRDAKTLVLMAHPDYWEDGGTTSGSDDYGFNDLRKVLTSQFQKADKVRYSLRYMDIKSVKNRAYVNVLVDASFTVPNAQGGESRLSKRDQNQLVLEWDRDKEQWMFLSGY